MSPELPFGLGGGEDDGSGFDPSKMDMSQLGDALQQLGRMLSQGGAPGDDGPVNWTLAHDTARATVSAAGDPSVGDAERRAVEGAVSLAQTWLDGATGFAATPGAHAWSRSEWLEATLPAWRRVIEPVAGHVQEATTSLLPGADATGALPALPEGLPPELAAMAGPLMGQFAGMAKSMGAAMFGTQVGQGLATLAAEVVGAGDVGIPLTDDSTPALLPRNVAAFGEGLGQPADRVQLYVALREAAQQRLFSHVGWLRPRLLEAVEAYARGIHVDRERIEEAARSIDPQRPRGAAGPARLRGVRARGLPAAAGRPGPPGDPAGARRGLGRRRRDDRDRGPAARRRGAARERAPSPRQRRPGGEDCSRPWSGSSCARAGCATPPRCGPACASTGVPTAATGCGPTPTCSPRPTTSTTCPGS